MHYQQTILKEVSLTGIGLHSGENVCMKLKPAEENTGIVFFRSDLNASLKVSPNVIKEAIMCTLLSDEKVQVSTIEHLMSCLSMMKIDNLIIEIDSPEMPVLDGSAFQFILLIESAGIKKLSCKRKYIKILKHVKVTIEDKYSEVFPSENTSYSFEILWNDNVISKTPSKIDFKGDLLDYKQNISKARTFGFIDKLEMLHKNNLAKGASLENAIGVSKDKVENPEGLRYKDEFVKHKLLDSIGDFYVGGCVLGKFNCYKSGHHLNNLLLKEIFSDLSNYDIIEL